MGGEGELVFLRLTGRHPALSDPQQTEGFRKRWFTMDDRRLMYFKDPLVRAGLGWDQRGPSQGDVSSPTTLRRVAGPRLLPMGCGDEEQEGGLDLGGPDSQDPPTGCLRSWGSLHRQQRERLHGAGRAPTVHPGPSLATRHHHRHAGTEVPAGLRDRDGAAGLGGSFSEGGGQAHATPGVRR